MQPVKRERKMTGRGLFELDRRRLLGGAAALGAIGLLGGCGTAAQTSGGERITTMGKMFMRGRETYQWTGANAWYFAWLGADSDYGDRARLGRELDKLKSIGVTNLRIMASGEEGPVKNSIKPGFVNQAGELNTKLLEGLDYAMAEIAKRGMVAVLCLTNFWEWSGGMANRLFYATGEWTDMNDPAKPWPAFPDATSKFYSNEQAKDGFYDYVRTIVTRVNTVTGKPYTEDPAIMAWQHCNEPRPGGTDEAINEALPHYYDWIDTTAALIRELDPNHLVSLGHEGTQGANGREDIVVRAHQNIDYFTAHIWPLNWGWVDGKDLAGTWDGGKAKVEDYIATAIRIANAANKPLAFEEFGFPRDGELYAPDVPTTFREKYYKLIYDAAEANSSATGGPVAGTNFWAWNGEARAKHEDFRYQNGDNSYMGDPMHEPQGWYGNFDSDEAMIKLIQGHAKAFALG
jgi:mannan endo-1,4-beta-mannosidase